MKNKIEHTPGPWTVSAHEDNGEIVVRSPATLNIICNCEADGFGEVGEKETSANARLIAAAPELLAALDCIHKSMEGFRGVVAWAQSEAAEKAFFTARAAIAKAKGG